jgi:hypothetical protein
MFKRSQLKIRKNSNLLFEFSKNPGRKRKNKILWINKNSKRNPFMN